MPITDSSMFRARQDILAEMLAELVGVIPDAYTGEDGVTRIIFEIDAGQLENCFLAHQILLEDMFITTASLSALQRHGQQYGVDMKIGTQALGTLTFLGDGGTYIPVGTEVGYDPGGGLDVIFFETTIDGTTPSPGTPTAPTLADAGAGSLPAGTYEYGVTFQTLGGETELGAVSAPLTIAASHNINLTAIPLGGAGTIARNLYRRINGGVWTKNTNATVVSALNNNTTTSLTDGSTTLGGPPPEDSTAESITLAARSQEVGVEGNVGIGTVQELTNAPATLISVTNPVAFTGGSDPEETEAYRQRLLAAVQAPSTGSISDLKVWAENVPGVESATVFPNTPAAGQATVRISGPNGSVPSAQVIADVQASLDALDFANIQVIVTSFTPQPTNVAVDVTTSGTYVLADVTPTVQVAITDYINSLEVGATLYLSGIVDSVFGLPGIADIVVTTPASNQTTAATDKRTPGVITVT